MAGNGKTERAALFTSSVAAIAATVAAVRSRAAKTDSQALQLPQSVIDLLSAIAQGVGASLETMDSMLDAIKNISITGGGSPPNADGITSLFVACPFVQPQCFQLPAVRVPQDCWLVLLARNPAGANAGIVYVAGSYSGASTTTQAYPLIPNATIAYKVKSADSIWIGATVAGEGVYITVEQ
jgi:hypothetical protein